MNKTGYAIKPSTAEDRARIIRIIEKPYVEEKDPSEFLDHFSDLFAGLKKYHYAAFFVNFIHIVRRITLILIAIYINGQPWIQTIFFVIIAEYICVYLFGSMPFESFNQNLLEIFNELTILVIGYHMIIVAGFNVPNYHKKKVGYSAIFFILLLIVVNVLHFIVCFAKWVKLHILRFKNIIAHRRRMNEKLKKQKTWHK